MKADTYVKWLPRSVACCLASGVFLSTTLAWGATVANVIVACTDPLCESGFTPAVVSINVSDQVKWIWGDSAPHNTESTAIPPLWTSGTPTVAPFSFTHTFTSAGNFPYWCSFHGFTGSVTVQAAASNAPPLISINSPTNGATFAAPWTGTIQAITSDSDDTVSKVDFFANTTLLGTVSNPPASLSLTVSNIAAGNYTLKAVATDSRGKTNTILAAVSVNIVTPRAITLSSPQKPSVTSFQFTYTADPGLSYIIQRAGNLATWVSLATNTAVSSPMPFTDNSATGNLDFYRVQLAPNR
jgi:plastocyanin